jgi:hypothetical protein
VGQVLAGGIDGAAVCLEIVCPFPLVFEEVRIGMEVAPEMVEALGIGKLMLVGMTEVPFADEARLVASRSEHVCDRLLARRETGVVPGMDLVVCDAQLDRVAAGQQGGASR